jgi:hypothetical protein
MVVVGLARRARLLFSRFLRMSILLCLALVGYGLVREPHWQNAIRRAMGMPTVPAGSMCAYGGPLSGFRR